HLLEVALKSELRQGRPEGDAVRVTDPTRRSPRRSDRGGRRGNRRGGEGGSQGSARGSDRSDARRADRGKGSRGEKRRVRCTCRGFHDDVDVLRLDDGERLADNPGRHQPRPPNGLKVRPRVTHSRGKLNRPEGQLPRVGAT